MTGAHVIQGLLLSLLVLHDVSVTRRQTLVTETMVMSVLCHAQCAPLILIMY